MEVENFALVREALMLTLLISAPILGIGLLVGLVISLLQAVTQVQEQTLAFVPKIVAMILVAVVLMGWMGTQMSAFAERMFGG
ncbi:MAG: flagellar biosynthesis protein FliQ [Planctomycetota bacterium]|nr:flagellar biosynthesis protein FliQ [Planctomycetota bacterium]MEC8559910.1 flagellar biosynthesis protein FliQ [Planctomycetota bacterium]MEC9158060.1 flagellar biosynthesis protein FliQ [Planctomycetota bacterium]MEC9233413.1 flagellar biosynthesis protein FliQ [Planctomycetota bacterium]MED5507005.1 flagellar biosynthesis protein FliQ [Planctomycetota bacterium]